MPFQFTCEQCGTSFTRRSRRSPVKPHTYCCLQCRAEAHRLPNSRFWDYVSFGQPHECWEWNGGRSDKGYGNFHVSGGTTTLAHRFAWELTHGRKPNGVIMHSCDNRGCVNPAHLREGTTRDNILDMWAKGRGKRSTLRGSQIHTAKLTEEDIPAIRALIASGHQPGTIAQSFGVSAKTVRLIRQGKAWRHVC